MDYEEIALLSIISYIFLKNNNTRRLERSSFARIEMEASQA